MSNDIREITPADAEWPVQLSQLLDPPARLWVRGGPLGELSARAIGIVGARAATSYGEFVASDLACSMAEREFSVVSGGAFGIDTAAHRGAMAATGVTGSTIAILAGGLDKPYPSENRRLFEAIADLGGAVVSEYAPGQRPDRTRFLERNRLIAALGRGLVVVECGIRSGTTNCVEQAVALQRPVMAVPGPVTSLTSVGTHAMIRNGTARLVTHAADVITALNLASLQPSPA